jgi:hypothetical protein
MLSVQEMECRNCGKFEHAKLDMKLTKNNLVQFDVVCDGCGTWSHQLEYNEVNRAVKRWLEANGIHA